MSETTESTFLIGKLIQKESITYEMTSGPESVKLSKVDKDSLKLIVDDKKLTTVELKDGINIIVVIKDGKI
jgi:hypothetical protein